MSENRKLVGLPDRLQKAKAAIEQYQAREQATIMTLAAMEMGVIDQDTAIKAIHENLGEPIVIPPLEI